MMSGEQLQSLEVGMPGRCCVLLCSCCFVAM